MSYPLVATSRVRLAFGRALALAALLALTGCGLPRSGPDYSEITSTAAPTNYGFHVLPVSAETARLANVDERSGFDVKLVEARAEAAHTFAPGDVLSITVWENIDEGLLNPGGIGATTLPATEVDAGGHIFVPYAGRLRAAGRTPGQLRAAITARLAEKTLNPQVGIARVSANGRQISVQGVVNKPGVYAIEPATTRLLAMLAQAGGVSIDPETARVKLRRGAVQGEIWLADLYDAPRHDVALRRGDALIVERDRRMFTALGAVQGSKTVPFPVRDLSVAQALGIVGGLDDRAADPTGVFLFREEPAGIAARLLPGTAGPQRVAYIIDLTQPAGLFLARDFRMRDRDTIFVTNAPFVKWLKILQGISPLVSFGGSARTLGGF